MKIIFVNNLFFWLPFWFSQVLIFHLCVWAVWTSWCWRQCRSLLTGTSKVSTWSGIFLVLISFDIGKHMITLWFWGLSTKEMIEQYWLINIYIYMHSSDLSFRLSLSRRWWISHVAGGIHLPSPKGKTSSHGVGVQMGSLAMVILLTGR